MKVLAMATALNTSISIQTGSCGATNGRPAYKFQSCFVIPPEGELISHPNDGYSNEVNREWSRSYALQRCKDRCSATSDANCQGVQVVPLDLHNLFCLPFSLMLDQFSQFLKPECATANSL